VRAALGLKPLKAESSNVRNEQEAGQAKRDEAEKAVKDAELKDRVQRSAICPNILSAPPPGPTLAPIWKYYPQHIITCLNQPTRIQDAVYPFTIYLNPHGMLVFLRARDKRQMEEGLAKVVNLGAAEAEVDDMAAWVARSRRGEEEAKRSAQRVAASRVATMYDEDVRPSPAPPRPCSALHTALAYLMGCCLNHRANTAA